MRSVTRWLLSFLIFGLSFGALAKDLKHDPKADGDRPVGIAKKLGLFDKDGVETFKIQTSDGDRATANLLDDGFLARRMASAISSGAATMETNPEIAARMPSGSPLRLDFAGLVVTLPEAEKKKGYWDQQLTVRLIGAAFEVEYPKKISRADFEKGVSIKLTHVMKKKVPLAGNVIGENEISFSLDPTGKLDIASLGSSISVAGFEDSANLIDLDGIRGPVDRRPLKKD